MKYRLKKDLPDLEAGEIFDDTDSFGHENGSMFDSGGTYRFEKDDIKHFDEWFEEAQENNHLFEDLTHDDQRDRVAVNIWFRKDRDGSHPKNMVAFIQFMKAVNVVSQDKGFMKKDNARFVYPIIKHSNLGAAPAVSSSRQHAGEFYFDSYEHSNASLDKHRDEWQTILNYDWSKE